MQPVKHLKNRLFEGCASDNTVINNHQIVYAVLDYSICHIIDMCGKIITGFAFGNEKYGALYP